MIPVYQTIFGAPDGNCSSAVVASILELPLRDVPAFKGGDGTWFSVMHEFLKSHGYTPKPHNRSVLPKGAYAYVVGMGPRGFRHACVWWGGPDGRIVHDPHPDGGGLAMDDPNNPLWWCVFEKMK